MQGATRLSRVATGPAVIKSHAVLTAESPQRHGQADNMLANFVMMLDGETGAEG